MVTPQFQVVQDEPENKTPKVEKAAINALMLALGALSQRAVIAIADSFVLIALASIFFLFYAIIQNPNTMQLIGVGMYGALSLCACYIIRRK